MTENLTFDWQMKYERVAITLYFFGRFFISRNYESSKGYN